MNKCQWFLQRVYFCELKPAIRYIQMSIIKDRIRSARKEILRRHRSRISTWNCWDKPFLQRSSSEPGPKPSTDPIYVSDTCHPCGPDSSRCLVYHWQGLSAKLFKAGGECRREALGKHAWSWNESNFDSTNEEVLKIWHFVDVRSNAICFRCYLKRPWSYRQCDSLVKGLVIVALLSQIKKV